MPVRFIILRAVASRFIPDEVSCQDEPGRYLQESL